MYLKQSIKCQLIFVSFILCAIYPVFAFKSTLRLFTSDKPSDKCEEFQFYSLCGHRTTCENINPEIGPCVSGCFCENGYVFESNHSNKCLPVTKCPKPPPCSLFEVYEQNGIEKLCPGPIQIMEIPKSGCHCKTGYFRTNMFSKCEATTCRDCGHKSYYDPNGPSIQRTCENYLIYHTFLNITYNTPGCVCQDGLYFDATSKKCVISSDCPNDPQCQENEEYQENGFNINCFDYNKTLHDFPTNKTATTEEKTQDAIEPFKPVTLPACYCKPGYVRDSTFDFVQKCIPVEECKCGPNQHLTKAGECTKSCKSQVCEYRQRRCNCDEGYFFESPDSQTCIKEEICPKTQCPTSDQIFKSGHDRHCPDGKLANLFGFPVEGCYCKEDHVFAADTNRLECIPYKQCPNVTCPKNSTLKLSKGDSFCSDIRNKKPSELLSADPWFDCFCEEGYVRNDKHDGCILAEDCPNCQENQYFNLFPGVCIRTCEDIQVGGIPTPCELKSGENTCTCNHPYVLESANSTKCVSVSECSCKENEVFSEGAPVKNCLDVLLHQANNVGGCFGCSNFGPASKLPVFNGPPGCYCKEGYIRAFNSSDCVPEDKCNPCGEGEVYKWATKEQTCENWALVEDSYVDHTASSSKPTSFLIPFNHGCFCKDGYVRKDDRTCVLAKDCPQAPKCRDNEEFKDSGTDKFCPALNLPDLELGVKCYCKNKFVRNFRNECISLDDCPACEGKGDNLFYSPCVHCFDYCDGTRNCSWDCLGDCDCKPGFVVEKKDGKCVAISSCPKVQETLALLERSKFVLGGFGG